MLLPLQEVGENPRTGTSTSLVIDLSCQPGKLSEETPRVQYKVKPREALTVHYGWKKEEEGYSLV